MKICCRRQGLQCTSPIATELHCLPHTPLLHPLHRCPLRGYHGNQGGYAANTGGAVIPDVSQHTTVLTDQEEELHFQVQTWCTDTQMSNALYVACYFKRRNLAALHFSHKFKKTNINHQLNSWKIYILMRDELALG